MANNSTVILARVSSKSQEDEGYSLDSQLKLLTNYCQNNSLEIVKTFRIAETASKQQSRKIFHEMMRFLKKEKIYHLAVEKTDRLTRNFSDAVAIDEWLYQDADRRLHAVKENILLHKEAKSDVKFMWNIHLSVAKKYTDNLREEAMKGWAEKLAQGWLPHSPPPGYITITEQGKRIHIPDPKTYKLIKRVFDFYLFPGQSISSTTKEMNRLLITTREGRPYHKSKVHRILSNPFYIGINRFNGIDYPGVQKTFISKETFNKVQAKIKRPLKEGRYRTHNPLFKGLIRCGRCNGLITWQIQKGRYYGTCQRKKPQCKKTKFIREDDIETLIIKSLECLAIPSKEIIDWVADSIRKEHHEQVETNEELASAINIRLKRIELMDENLYDDKLAGDISAEKYKEKHNKLAEEKTKLEKQLMGIDSSIAKKVELTLLLLELTQKAAEIYPKKSIVQKRVIITKLFKSLVKIDDRLSVSYTNFAKIIAENVAETNKLIGGAKCITKP